MEQISCSASQSSSERTFVEPLQPPAELAVDWSCDWIPLSLSDPVVEHITQNYWSQPVGAWEAVRFSKAVYLYREMGSGYAVIAKFYQPKTGASAQKHAHQEMRYIEQVRAAGLSGEGGRAIRALGTWRGILFLEYVEGLTLADVIAVRQSRPGSLMASLTHVAGLLARLHTAGEQSDARSDFEPALGETLEYVAELVAHGVLNDEPTVADGLRRLIERWGERPAMACFTPALVHGDATTTNFVFPGQDGVVVIDWERLHTADPAFDLGRLAAELVHSVRRQGGRGAETAFLVRHFLQSYHQASPADGDADELNERVCFYQASSLLRIARNGWVPLLERMALVAQAMALLA
ncbi:MAG TPA: aminoglycoside phosphotransferase family protein [Chloroflexi bacterium]|nr:aminoglycoside phosphotransferase family protein [Chloroflexota bacterium]